MIDHSLVRAQLINDLDKQLRAAIRRLENEFNQAVRDFYTEELNLVDGAVEKGTTANFARVNRIENLSNQFTRVQGAAISKDIARGFTRLIQVNESYFAGIAFVSGGLQKQVKRQLLARYGLRESDSGIDILRGGWVQKIGELRDPFTRVQEIGISAVSQGITLGEFKKQIRDAAFDKGARSIKHHFQTNANDAYAQFDRTTQTTYADELGLRAFIYEGGLIETSREFCNERNGKVFTTDEAEAWKLLNWKGKNKDYDPLRDMGGHNCRHHPSFISDELAMRLRPELAELLN